MSTMSGFTLCRIVDVPCIPIPGIREEIIWTGSEILKRALTPVDNTALSFLLTMRHNPEIDRVEWMQSGQHYLLRRMP